MIETTACPEHLAWGKFNLHYRCFCDVSDKTGWPNSSLQLQARLALKSETNLMVLS